ncbi:MAG: hypothetical protein HYX79_10310 [Chloroflexi bacterium]|nr:hypothetical protein [Chloroflexota bacterium]
MAILSIDELRTIIKGPGEGKGVSLYMPTNRTGDTEQNSIRFRNLLRAAEERLVASGARPADARRMLKPARGLLSDAAFWQHQGDGLAVFLSQEVFKHYSLPSSFQELVVAAERFHVKPLLPLFRDGLFYVLAVSMGKVMLLQCTRDSLRVVTPESVPTNLAEALRYDQTEKQQKVHIVATPGGPGRGGAVSGYGEGSTDGLKDSALRYFQQVNRGLHEVLKEERAPLVVAGVDYIQAIYREANTYPHLLSDGVKGNVDEMTPEALHQQARVVVKPYFERDEIAALARYNKALGTGLATGDLEQAVLAAYVGRVYILFVALDAQQWGKFDAAQHKVVLHQKAEPGDEDLLDFAAVYTLTKGGSVYAVAREKMPGGSPVAAIYRY